MESLTKAFDGEIISWNGSESKPSSFEMVEQSTARAAPLLALLLAEESADGATITASYPAALPEDIQHDQLLQICGSGAAFTLVTGKGDDVEASRRFTFCRRFRRVSAGGRDVGRRRMNVLVAIATQPVFALAPQVLVAAEGALRVTDAAATPGGGKPAAAARAETGLADIFKSVESAPERLGIRSPHRELRRSERGRLSHCGFLSRVSILRRCTIRCGRLPPAGPLISRAARLCSTLTPAPRRPLHRRRSRSSTSSRHPAARSRSIYLRRRRRSRPAPTTGSLRTSGAFPRGRRRRISSA